MTSAGPLSISTTFVFFTSFYFSEPYLIPSYRSHFLFFSYWGSPSVLLEDRRTFTRSTNVPHKYSSSTNLTCVVYVHEIREKRDTRYVMTLFLQIYLKDRTVDTPIVTEKESTLSDPLLHSRSLVLWVKPHTRDSRDSQWVHLYGVPVDTNT